nr:manganese efflux pump [Pelosinus sp. IPA-1]
MIRNGFDMKNHRGVLNMGLFYVLLLATGVSIDALAAGTAYGLKSIRVPLLSLTVIGTITGIFTLGAMISAQFLEEVINPSVVTGIGALLLLALGFWNIIIEYLSRITNKHNSQSEKITPSLGEMIIEVMVQPEMADSDKSCSISYIEAISLGIALGMDNMIATFAACMLGDLPVYTPLIMAGVQMMLIVLGIQVATFCVPDHLKNGLPYMSGVVLIIIGLTRLI